ncbi:MAG: hypothetical protein A2Z57_10495 [Planctomycetes bacterium RIFCSPHIGHO2_12_39_6]|nr:MAG: hypothetical protein A2Z57_10495 [Planctomycetes bacterium RIFCSPHIGHO2_12_39_6]
MNFGLGNVAAIHELPLRIVTEVFPTIDVFKKTKRSIRARIVPNFFYRKGVCYKYLYKVWFWGNKILFRLL